MSDDDQRQHSEARRRLEKAYKSQKPRLMARLRAAGRTLEEAEDLVHDVYAETMERLPIVAGIYNLPAWINSLFAKRLIDLWRHEKVRERCAIGAAGDAEAGHRGTGLRRPYVPGDFAANRRRHRHTDRPEALRTKEPVARAPVLDRKLNYLEEERNGKRRRRMVGRTYPASKDLYG